MPEANQTAQRDEFDYIIVGAGASGSVIANRLSEDANTSVLLLEAGGPEPYPPLDQFLLIGSKFDWKYQTEPEPGLDNRRLDWPRGKVMGGSSAISSMIYLRGNRLDYNHWNYLGNEGWNYSELLPYFRKAENNRHFHGEFHGNSGPLNVESSSDDSTLKQGFRDAAESCGFKSDVDWDFNGATQEGVAGLYQKTLKNGESHSAGAAYLVPILDRPNLVVRTHTFATNFVWEGGRVQGIGYVTLNWDDSGTGVARYLSGLWNLRTARARREVIVSAGSVDSPKLLMLGGIGPAEELRRHGIEVKQDLPGVGQNLQDHLNITFIYKPNSAASPVQNRIGTSGLFLRSRNAMPAASPDLQLYAVEVMIEQAVQGFPVGPLYFCTACAGRPHGRGRITLRSADPLAAPVIRANYLQCRRDVSVLRDGMGLLRRMANSSPLRRLLEFELLPGPDCKTAEQLETFLRGSANTNFHPVGTCKMGHDAMAVVDSELRVYGVEGLRVADASIMPTIVDSNTIAPSVMIGEKAAAMIRGDG